MSVCGDLERWLMSNREFLSESDQARKLSKRMKLTSLWNLSPLGFGVIFWMVVTALFEDGVGIRLGRTK
jgi:hypothetical protein